MEDVLKTWNQLAELIGSLIRPLGGLVFGVAIGWIIATILLDAAREWQLKIAIFLGLIGAFVSLTIHAGAGTTGFFALGAGVAAIFFVIRQNQPAKPKK